ncbi:uncharacterized protein [Prorops nasuta]
MPTHVGPYGVARYPSTLLRGVQSFYSPVSVYSSGFSYYGSLQPAPASVQLPAPETLPPPPPPPPVPLWSQRMPAEEESPSIGVSGGPLANPPSPAHSDSDASSSSLELGSIRRGENAQLRCRWQNCGRWFASLEQLAGHVARLHAAPGPRGLFYCGWEGCARGERGFNARYKMLVHVRTHTNEKPHHCFQCDKSFSRAENLKIHARSHTGERPYVCPVEGCNKAYSNSSDRFKHTRTHAVDKPYCCKVPDCPKRYTDPSSLRKHVKTYRHYANNNNDKLLQEKSCYDDGSAATRAKGRLQQQQQQDSTSPEKQSGSSSSSALSHSESDKKDSSIESISSSSPKGSNSFEEQRSFVEWNNMYNLQEQRSQQESLAINKINAYPRIYDENYMLPGRIQVNPMYASSLPDNITVKERRPSPLPSPQTSPSHSMDTAPRIGMQSTPIKSEYHLPTECPNKTTVDYRNIESIVSGMPSKKEAIKCDPVRNSVIKRAEDLKMEVVEQIEQKTIDEDSIEKTSTECCCRHKCCAHSTDNLFEKTKILSDLILKTQNPLFRHLLNSVDLQYNLQNMWTNATTDNSNTCAQDLRVKNENVTEMEQDLPLDLTISK